MAGRLNEQQYNEKIEELLDKIHEFQVKIGWNNGQIANALAYIVSMFLLRATTDNPECMTCRMMIEKKYGFGGCSIIIASNNPKAKTDNNQP